MDSLKNSIRKTVKRLIKKGDFDLEAIKKCIECRGCERDCPSFKAIPAYDPTRINIEIVEGDGEKWLSSETIWQCLECHTCSEMCPQVYSWEKVMKILKTKALQNGFAPSMVARGVELFLKTGRLGEPRLPMRSELGLPRPAVCGTSDFKKLKEMLRVEPNRPNAD